MLYSAWAFIHGKTLVRARRNAQHGNVMADQTKHITGRGQPQISRSVTLVAAVPETHRCSKRKKKIRRSLGKKCRGERSRSLIEIGTMRSLAQKSGFILLA